MALARVGWLVGLVEYTWVAAIGRPGSRLAERTSSPIRVAYEPLESGLWQPGRRVRMRDMERATVTAVI